MTANEREAKIVAIRECAAWLTRTLEYPPPSVLRVARRRLAKELEDRAERLEARLLLDRTRKR